RLTGMVGSSEGFDCGVLVEQPPRKTPPAAPPHAEVLRSPAVAASRRRVASDIQPVLRSPLAAEGGNDHGTPPLTHHRTLAESLETVGRFAPLAWAVIPPRRKVL